MASAVFANNSGPGLFTADPPRPNFKVAARKWPMKLYMDTANKLLRSRCSEIGSPGGKKMPMNNLTV
jgi:hypothetical protein